jgi:hypothetical protein
MILIYQLLHVFCVIVDKILVTRVQIPSKVAKINNYIQKLHYFQMLHIT